MRLNKSLLWAFILLIVVAALYRVFPNRPWGFAPQIAMAVFAGAMINYKKWAFALPLFSMFLSDVIYQVLYTYGVMDMPGIYKGQLQNYLLFMGVTCLGFTMKRVTAISVFAYGLLAPTLFFLASNFLLWINGGGLQRPKTWAGLMQCYTDALPFYKGSLLAGVVFSIILFGGYYLLNKSAYKTRMA
ncbi:MAG: DUF6580 family putative transport protein [Chitinophagaceae bacterium]